MAKRLATGAFLAFALVGAVGCNGGDSGAGPSGTDAGSPVDSGTTSDATAADSALTDGAVSDATGTDAPTSEAGGDAGSCTGALVCDDFESYPLNGPPHGPWKVTTNGGGIVID